MISEEKKTDMKLFFLVRGKAEQLQSSCSALFFNCFTFLSQQKSMSDMFGYLKLKFSQLCKKTLFCYDIRKIKTDMKLYFCQGEGRIAIEQLQCPFFSIVSHSIGDKSCRHAAQMGHQIWKKFCRNILKTYRKLLHLKEYDQVGI